MQHLGKEIKKKKRSRKLCKDMKRETLSWLSHTQFHGAKILANRESSSFWIPLMLVLLMFTIILMYLTIERYLLHPTFIGRKEPVYKNQSFPSVIICPEIYFEDYKIVNFLSNLSYPEGLNRSYIWRIIPQLSAFTSPDVLFNVDDLENIETFLDYNNINIENATRQLTLSCEEILLRCRWKSDMVNCAELFHMEMTGDGLCCVFNGRSLRREMQEKGHNHITEKPIIKWRISRIGYISGLMVAINQSQKHDAIDFSYKWMSLQPAQRFVDINMNGTALNPTREQWLTHHINSWFITETAKDLSSRLRRCQMDSQPLKYFPVYRQKYCILECEMARTIRMCGCVRTVHPRPWGIAYCNARHVQCARYAMVSLTNKHSCFCPPTCTADSSYTGMSSFTLNSGSRTIDTFYDGLNYSKITVVRAFFSRNRKAKERHSYFSYLDLFAQLGGMFNIVFGCSILTILSLLHLILKLMIIMCRRLRERMPKIKKIIKVDTMNKI